MELIELNKGGAARVLAGIDLDILSVRVEDAVINELPGGAEVLVGITRTLHEDDAANIVVGGGSNESTRVELKEERVRSTTCQFKSAHGIRSGQVR